MSNLVANNERRFPFLRLLFRKLVYVILVAVLIGAAGFAYGTYVEKPNYKASSAVILRMGSEESASGKAMTEIALAKYYLPTIAELAVSPTFIADANSRYAKEGGQGKISADAISIVYGDDSLIFSISYTDENDQVASDKLDAFISSVAELLENNNDLVKAKKITLIPTQNRNSIEIETGKARYTLLGTFAGGAIAVLVLFLLFKFNNTVTDKMEFEEMTGLDVLSTINKIN